jgi:2-phospho-L-lactate guanylyltransferase
MTGSGFTNVRRKEPASKGWVAVVPVKDPARAKSRLGVGADARVGRGADVAGRIGLARAFAEDVLTALKGAQGVKRIVVITDGNEISELAWALGCESLADPTESLNEAIKFAADSISGEEPICVWVSDLPCLQPDDVERVLAQAASAFATEAKQAFVPDDNSGGTTALLARTPKYLTPHFGPNSAKAHEAAGAKPLTGTPRSRLDVDTQDDLSRAIALGVGPATQGKKTRARAKRPRPPS